MIQVGLIGIGAIGRLHFDCWRKSPHAKVTAIASRDAKKRAGHWDGAEFNLGDQAGEKVDLSGIRTYEDAKALIEDPEIAIVDICAATPLHAPLTIAALRAGKDVICEKPMALLPAECLAMEEAVAETGRQLMIAHCLRYWPHYVRARQAVESGEFGKPVYARLHRSGGAPKWSEGGWLLKANESGGVLDLHIHDIDVALWWFGEPSQIFARTYTASNTPMIVDAEWSYVDGPLTHLHGAWDPNGGAFRHAFRLVFERATLEYDLALAPDVLRLYRDGECEDLAMPKTEAHQAELDDFAECIAAGRRFTRFTPAESRRSVEIGLQELAAGPTGQVKI